MLLLKNDGLGYMDTNYTHIIEINEHSTLGSVQAQFNKVFPYLKVSFYSKLTDKKNGEKLKLLDQLEKELVLLSKTAKDSVSFFITPDLSVTQLDQLFIDHFGLHILIHRNSGRLWLQINATDSWSLEEQNKQGEDLCA
jgi:hypothetical protein